MTNDFPSSQSAVFRLRGGGDYRTVARFAAEGLRITVIALTCATVGAIKIGLTMAH